MTKNLTEALAAERNYPEALTYGRKLLLLDPFDEEYHRAIMTFHAATGNYEAALKLQVEFPDITDILTYSMREEFSSAGDLIVLAPSYSLPFRNEEKSLIQTARESDRRIF